MEPGTSENWNFIDNRYNYIVQNCKPDTGLYKIDTENNSHTGIQGNGGFGENPTTVVLVNGH